MNREISDEVDPILVVDVVPNYERRSEFVSGVFIHELLETYRVAVAKVTDALQIYGLEVADESFGPKVLVKINDGAEKVPDRDQIRAIVTGVKTDGLRYDVRAPTERTRLGFYY
jgi:hypothetical protein